jgi:hypothetical protein
MENHIRQHSIVYQAFSPMEAEIRIKVEVDYFNDTTEVRGRLVGPRCALASTVEVAYPLRPVKESAGTSRILRAVVPEPNRWSQETPFLYRAIIELWQDESRCDRVEFDHGFT